MAWIQTNKILARFHAALAFDLDPGWSPPNQTLTDADNEVNSGRSSLVTSKVTEDVRRYSIAPDLAANQYAEKRGKGLVVGYSIGAQPSDPDLRTGAGRPRKARLPVEVSIVRVLDGQKDMLHVDSGLEPGTAAYDLDRVQDLIMKGLQERSAADFGVNTLAIENVQRLGIEGFPGWIGRLLEYEVLRDMRNITAT